MALNLTYHFLLNVKLTLEEFMKVSLEIVTRELEKTYLRLAKFIDDAHLQKQAMAYHEKLRYIEEHIFVKVCRRWSQEKIPTVLNILHECKELEIISKENSLESSNLLSFLCDHFLFFSKHNFTQNEKEVKMCSLENLDMIKFKSEEHDGFKNLNRLMIDSKKQFGSVLCEWHQQLAIARFNPDSHQGWWCKKMIENSPIADTLEGVIVEVREKLKNFRFREIV